MAAEAIAALDQPRTDRVPSAEQAALKAHLTNVASTGSYPYLAAARPAGSPIDDEFDRFLGRVITGLLSSDN